LTGSMLGSRVLVQADTLWLRRVFALVILALGLEMIYQGVRGHI